MNEIIELQRENYMLYNVDAISYICHFRTCIIDGFVYFRYHLSVILA